MEKIKNALRDVPDFPKPGIIFKDITPLLTDPEAFRFTIDQFVERYKDQKIDLVLGVESRGFIFAGPLAYLLGAGFVIVRKPGKLPAETYKETYELEYGTDTLEIHVDAIKEGQRVLIIDDLLATGGTVSAVTRMVKKLGGVPVECSFVVELAFLKGRDKIKDVPVFSLVQY